MHLGSRSLKQTHLGVIPVAVMISVVELANGVSVSAVWRLRAAHVDWKSKEIGSNEIGAPVLEGFDRVG